MPAVPSPRTPSRPLSIPTGIIFETDDLNDTTNVARDSAPKTPINSTSVWDEDAIFAGRCFAEALAIVGLGSPNRFAFTK